MPNMKEILEYKSSIDMMPLEDLEARLVIKSADAKYQDWQYEIEKEIRDSKRALQLERQIAKNNYAIGKRTITVRLADDGYWYPCDSSIETSLLGGVLIPTAKIRIDANCSQLIKLKTQYDTLLEEDVPIEVCYPENIEPSPLSKNPKRPAQENVFRRDGEFWEIYFKGKRLPLMEDRVGMIYIEHLLKNPAKEYSYFDLLKLTDLKQFLQIQDDFKADREIFVYNSPDRIQSLKGTGQKIQQKISKNINDALKAFKKHSPEFKIHFSNSKKTGSFSLSYVPEQEMNWS